jgi:2'-5' RNA ligase
MPRLFTGLELPADIASQLSTFRGGLFGARWIEPEDYHITLRFIGDVDIRTAHEVADLLDGVRKRPVEVTLRGIDSFGGDRPRSVYASVAPSPGLSELQAEHERLMQRVGLPAGGRKYTPHVTLARLNRDVSSQSVAHYLASRPLIRPITFRPTRFALFSSKDSVGGGPYIVEATYPLAA